MTCFFQGIAKGSFSICLDIELQELELASSVARHISSLFEVIDRVELNSNKEHPSERRFLYSSDETTGSRQGPNTTSDLPSSVLGRGTLDKPT